MPRDWIKLDRNTKSLPNSTIFRSLLGSLMYLAVQTRPDIAFATSRIACYAHEPLEQDLEALMHICFYLKSTIDVGLTFKKGNAHDISVIGFSDSDFAEERTTRKSTTGSIWTLNGTPISWNSKRQDIVTTSSTEAELVALDFALKEGIWIKKLLLEIGLVKDEPIKLMTDNQSTIKIVKGSKITQRTKHIDVKYMFARELYQSNRLNVEYIASNENPADAFTKPLSYEGIFKLQTIMQGMNIQS